MLKCDTASVFIDGVTYKHETDMYPSKLITKVIFAEKDKEEKMIYEYYYSLAFFLFIFLCKYHFRYHKLPIDKFQKYIRILNDVILEEFRG